MWETVRKIALSLSVIVLFALYAVQRQTRPLIASLTIAKPVSGASSSALISSPVEAASNGTARDFAGEPDAAPTMSPAPTATATLTVTLAASDAATATATVVPPPTAMPTPALAQGKYRDGTYDGGPADANWGAVEVQAVIAGGRLSDVRILQYPDHHGRSVAINQWALPMLIQEAVQAQQAEVDVVSGASDTSEAFIQSLGAALQQAAT